MSDVWSTLIKVQELFIDSFNKSGVEIQEPGMDRFNQPGWVNRVWTSNAYRRAHLDVVDARDSKGLWMMHCCIFPHIDNPAPIFGFDVIAGKNKITGCFHDFSPLVRDWNHPLIAWFAAEVSNLGWNKQRTLPEWAERIFSPHMVAAGNVQDKGELAQIVSMTERTLSMYLNSVADTNGSQFDGTAAQNFYAQNQKQNPHTPRVMASLGLNEEDVRAFVQECLFPEIK